MYWIATTATYTEQQRHQLTDSSLVIIERALWRYTVCTEKGRKRIKWKHTVEKGRKKTILKNKEMKTKELTKVQRKEERGKSEITEKGRKRKI